MSFNLELKLFLDGKLVVLIVEVMFSVLGYEGGVVVI